jgi:hypothetical protein
MIRNAISRNSLDTSDNCPHPPHPVRSCEGKPSSIPDNARLQIRGEATSARLARVWFNSHANRQRRVVFYVPTEIAVEVGTANIIGGIQGVRLLGKVRSCSSGRRAPRRRTSRYAA